MHERAGRKRCLKTLGTPLKSAFFLVYLSFGASYAAC